MSADFLIIGGGVAGLSAGAKLAPLGNVCLLEAEDALGYHASGRSAAMFEETYGPPSTVALNQASRAPLMDDHKDVLSPRGLMLLGQTDQNDQFNADKFSMKMDEISMADAAARVPILNTVQITRAALHEDAWDIDTDLLLQNYTRALRRNGQVHTNCRVTRIERTKTGWRAHASSAVFEGKVLLNAAGAWADQVAKMAGIAPIGLVPKRRSMARIPAPGGRDVSRWPMIFGTGESWYAKPDAGNLIVSPADADPVEPMDAWADDIVLAKGLAKYEAAVTEPVTRMLANWAGLRTFAPDGTLVLGPEPATPGFVWVAGQGGYGMQSSPAAGDLIADLIGGRTSVLDAKTRFALSPARFRDKLV